MMSLVAGAAMFNSCNDDDSTSGSGDYSYKIRMTDAPGPYSAVNVDIQNVAVIDGNGNTVMLDADTGVHNLLDLSNGADILLASRNLEDNEVSKIKITLGNNNSVVVDGQTYPLTLSAADEAGLTINVNQTLQADANNEILIDFDANSSVVATGATTYKIDPVITRIDASVTGSISGDTNNTSLAVVTAVSASNAYYNTSINANGNFKLRGLPPGTYTLVITPVLPLLPSTQSNIVVQANQNTTVSAITF